jgi:CRISPR system Cascade subunit CasE
MFLVQVPVNFTAAVRHLKPFLQPSAFDDETLILKTILWEGFSGGVVRPWAAHAQRGPITTVLGYSQAGADELNKRRALALPSVQAAVGETLTAALPPLGADEQYRFSIRLVPTVRITKSETRRYGERDAFLVKVEAAAKDGPLTRDDVYRDYLRERLPGATIDTSRLVQFRLRPFMRPRADGSVAKKTMPEAVLEGTITVSDPEKLIAAIAQGIGRQRAYGCGMLKLQPA